MLMAPALTANLTKLADAFAAHRGWTLSTVSKRIARDSAFLNHVRTAAVGSFTTRKYDDVVCCFAANWPADLAWPEGVPRPTLAEISATIGAPAPPSEPAQAAAQ